jgi:hypothetical protein
MAAVATLAQANVRDQLVVAAGGALDGSPTGNGWRSAHLIDSQSLGCKNSVRNLTGKILKRGPWRPLPKIWQVVARLECIEVSTCSVFRC